MNDTNLPSDSVNRPEPPPQPNDEAACWDEVVEDMNGTDSSDDQVKAIIAIMEERDQVGAKKYGTRLQPHNGRNPLVDLFQELLDASVYAKQAIMEGNTSLEAEYRSILQLIVKVHAMFSPRGDASTPR